MLEQEFDTAMWRTVDVARKHKYTPTYFMQMLEEHGGVQTAKRLLAGENPQYGLDHLWEMGLLHESMEAQVIKEKFQSLFTVEEINEAKKRLIDRGFNVG
ncbi:MAG: hypothetical protein JW725_03545 [Candidatus Babeliaceae bacterium]|nr:hypothetical protein [Candidatus Babeliaceae bacterium]